MPPKRRTTQASVVAPLDPIPAAANQDPPATVMVKPSAKRSKKANVNAKKVNVNVSAVIEESIPIPTNETPVVKAKSRTRSQTAVLATLPPTNPSATVTKERKTRSQTTQAQEPSSGLQDSAATATKKRKVKGKIAEGSSVDPKEPATATLDPTLPPRQASRKRTALGTSSAPEEPATSKRRKAKKSSFREKDLVDNPVEQLPAVPAPPTAVTASEAAFDGTRTKAKRKTSSTQRKPVVPASLTIAAASEGTFNATSTRDSRMTSSTQLQPAAPSPESEVQKNAGNKPKPQRAAASSNHANRKISRFPTTSSATLTESTTPTNSDASTSTSKRSTSTSGTSGPSASTNKGKGKRKASSPTPQALLDEIADLKSRLAQSEAQRDKEEKIEAAKSANESRPLIPQPRGKYNLQEAMGLKNNKELYNQCRAIVHSCVAKSDLPTDIDWRRQDSGIIARICSIAKDLEPQLRMYERSWAITDIIRTIFKNRRNYVMKLKAGYLLSRAKVKKNHVERISGVEDNDGDFESSDDEEKGAEDDEQSVVELGDKGDDQSGDDFEREIDSRKTAMEPMNEVRDEDEFDDSDLEMVDLSGGGTVMEAMDEDAPENMSRDGDEDEEMFSGDEEEQADSEDDGDGIDEGQVKSGRESLKRPLTLSEESSDVKRRKKGRVQ